MGRGDFPPIRSLPRVVVPGATPDGMIELPQLEIDKFRKVLRLEKGHHVAILPNDGTLIRCEFLGRTASPIEVVAADHTLRTVCIAQALPKGDRLETVVRMGTELGVTEFILFPADRSVVKWDSGKIQDRLRRLEAIAREATEQSFGFFVPRVSYVAGLGDVLKKEPDAIVLDESETAPKSLVEVADRERTVLVVGPEGGWSPREASLFSGLGVTLGTRLLRTDTAGIAAAARLLIR